MRALNFANFEQGFAVVNAKAVSYVGTWAVLTRRKDRHARFRPALIDTTPLQTSRADGAIRITVNKCNNDRVKLSRIKESHDM